MSVVLEIFGVALGFFVLFLGIIGGCLVVVQIARWIFSVMAKYLPFWTFPLLLLFAFCLLLATQQVLG